MNRISVDEMGRDLPGYIQRVEAGETLVIVRGGKPVAEIKPAAPETAGLRPFGLCSGEFVVPDDFDMPLPESVMSEFEGR
ncbi:MAG TPA: type II toxin-antitoxin system Phd/YefM family antitoxin [Chloroflexia bacterium]|nr:type II toxin-antitoxin system Phd/YefM family antitoxin [Chloroflexia bacterium]